MGSDRLEMVFQFVLLVVDVFVVGQRGDEYQICPVVDILKLGKSRQSQRLFNLILENRYLLVHVELSHLLFQSESL